MDGDYKFVAILNKKIALGRLLNALGHMTAGLAGGYEKTSEMNFLRYEDKEGGIHPNISYYPFIILRADTSNHIRTVRNLAIEKGIAFTDFTHTMVEGSSEEQLERTKNTSEADLEYFGICLFGQRSDVDPVTRKFSLFK